MVRDFFSQHKSHSPYFLEISQEFLAYLQNERTPQPEDPAGMLELAHYEWVELALTVSEDTIEMENIDPNGDLLQGPAAQLAELRILVIEQARERVHGLVTADVREFA